MLTADFSTHRPLAWGVLGLAIGGLLFSLLTLLFSGVVPGKNPSPVEKFRELPKIFWRLKCSTLCKIDLTLPLQSDLWPHSGITIVLAAISSAKRGSFRRLENSLSL